MKLKHALTGKLCPFFMGQIKIKILYYNTLTQINQLKRVGLTLGLLLAGSLYAQQSAMPLQVGDTVPPLDLGRIMHADGAISTGKNLQSYTNKLLILDFWATWCSACISNMPKLEELKLKSGGRIAVLGVNGHTSGDTEAKIRAFLAGQENAGQPGTFETIVGDKELEKLFPYRIVPHYVWVGPGGIVRAITGADGLTWENAERIFAGGNATENKADIDRSAPLLLGKIPSGGELQHYSILVKGYLIGLPTGRVMRQDGGKEHGILLSNHRLLSLYQLAVKGARPWQGSKRILTEVTDRALLYPEQSTLPRKTWQQQNLYSYDLILPLKDSGLLYTRMLEDLNRYSPVTGRFENRERHCYALVVTDSTKMPVSAGGVPANTMNSGTDRGLTNQPVAKLVQWLNNKLPDLEVIDATGFSGKLDIKVLAGAPPLTQLQQLLAGYGMRLRQETRSLECFIISDKP